MNEKRRYAAPAAEEIEGQLEGRNALTEALRSGRTIDKVFIAAGDTDGRCSIWPPRPRKPAR